MNPPRTTPLAELLTDDLLNRTAGGAADALETLDEHGLFPAPGEDAPQFAERLRTLRKNTADLEETLRKDGAYDLDGWKLAETDRINPERFRDAASVTRKLAHFTINWVPGFFLDPACAFLFGGAAMVQLPDFFTLFIIRKSFKNSPKWLIYSRTELMAHELCHVARAPLNARRFEEAFAYRTSTSPFRKFLGGMFMRPADSFAFLGAALLLLAGQLIRTLLLPQCPLWPFTALLLLVFTALTLRHFRAAQTLNRAGKTLRTTLKDRAGSVLFRCTDDEIAQLAALRPDRLGDWLQNRLRSPDSLRWTVILKRFR